ncbi:MAG TPA: BON domain-containing protein, partial [Planctomycetota bacterium]|nr:BON domain-containing protein [Planctomycetota bacterium]
HLSQQALAAIRIDVKQGVVRLQGDVPRSSDRVLAGTLTRSVDGVSAVRNELTVSAEEPPDHLDGGLVKN